MGGTEPLLPNEDYDDRDDAILRSAHQDMVTLTGNDLLANVSMY